MIQVRIRQCQAGCFEPLNQSVNRRIVSNSDDKLILVTHWKAKTTPIANSLLNFQIRIAVVIVN